jgi:hypothetical protein
MPDNNHVHPAFAGVLNALAKPATAAAPEPDGYVVIASKLCTGSVKPPYRHNHMHDWFASLEEAGDHYAALERNEYDGWRPAAILPTFGGIPRREMALGYVEIARLVKEAEAA